MPKRKSNRKKPCIIRFSGGKIFIFNTVKSFVTFYQKIGLFRKDILPKILPMTSEAYLSTGQVLGKKIKYLNITPLVYAKNLLSYLNDDVAALCEDTGGTLHDFLEEVRRSSRRNNFRMPEIFIWDRPYFT